MKAKPSFVLIGGKHVPVKRLIWALQAAGAGAGVVVEEDPALAIAKVHEAPLAVFTTAEKLEETLAAMGNDAWRVFVLCAEPHEAALEMTLKDNRIGGVLAWGQEGGRPWELRYLARRLLDPNDIPPRMGELLGWGTTTVVFRPKTTTEERQISERIEVLGRRLGLTRRQATKASTASHELMMNAMYDAPVDHTGRVKYAMERTADLSLEPAEIPTLCFAVSADYVALDCIDPFGRLPRVRYYEAVLRGHRNIKYSRSDLDTSHGGAGLGLHTLYTSGSILRAEMQPLGLTHVSWVLDRRHELDGPPKAGESTLGPPRSLYYLPYFPR